eukprot:2081842-Rhodomonas_salina.2
MSLPSTGQPGQLSGTTSVSSQPTTSPAWQALLQMIAELPAAESSQVKVKKGGLSTGRMFTAKT